MASPKKRTTTKSSKKAKPSNSTNKNRSVTAEDVKAAKKAVKQQLAPLIDSAPIKSSDIVTTQAKVVDNSFFKMNSKPRDPQPVVGPNGTFYPFKSFLPEGVSVAINLNSITRVMPYSTHADVCQISMDNTITQLVKHSLSEVMSIIGSPNNV
jgi:hypothetical protein